MQIETWYFRYEIIMNCYARWKLWLTRMQFNRCIACFLCINNAGLRNAIVLFAPKDR